MRNIKIIDICAWAAVAVVVVVMAVATWVENQHGSDYVASHIYQTWWFAALWGVIALLGMLSLAGHALWRRLPVFFLHISWLVILAGALITHLCGVTGMLHLREGHAVSQMLTEGDGEPVTLPFELQLDSFVVQNYPGTDAPQDYISYVTLSSGGDSQQKVISMNKVLQEQGYRFYQSSFDEDKQGSWLSVNYDPWGIGITYLGYALLGITMLACLLLRSGPFRQLLRHPMLKKGIWLLALLLNVLPAQAQTRKLPVLNRAQADSLARVQVIYNDRVVPFNTLARDFVLKLYGKDNYHGFTPEQVVGGWLLSPEKWRNEPILKIKQARLRDSLQIEGRYASLTDLYTADGQYRLQPMWQRLGQQQADNALSQAILEVDEKVGLALMLEKGTLIKPVSETEGVEPLSETRISAELWYNRVPFTKVSFMVCLTLGFLSFFSLLYKGIRKETGNAPAWPLFRVLLYVALAVQLLAYSLRWYIAGRIPLSNGFETMQFMALTMLVLAILLERRFAFMIVFGFLLSGFTLLVSHLGQMTPQITPLMPVLVSPLLSLHVSVIMIAYALLAFTWLNAVLALCLRQQEAVAQLAVLSRVLLYPGLFLMAAGIFLGAVWANVSWGSYWSWDPKEVWALITLLVYSVPFHRSSLSFVRNDRAFHVYMLLAFLVILMTYFGVNYLLGGMHSYANA